MIDDILGKNNPLKKTNISDEKIKAFLGRLKDAAKKVGVVVARKALQGFFLLVEIMRNPKITIGDKILVVGVLIYILKKGDLINDAIGIFGLIDDTVFAAFEYKRLKEIVTPEMIRNANLKAENQLFEWGMVDMA